MNAYACDECGHTEKAIPDTSFIKIERLAEMRTISDKRRELFVCSTKCLINIGDRMSRKRI